MKSCFGGGARKARIFLGGSLLLAAALGVSCGEKRSSSANPAPSPAAAAEGAMVAMKGVVRGVDIPGKQILIQHEEATWVAEGKTNLMSAMTMPFPVKNEAELRGLMTNDPVTFRLHLPAGGEPWIDRIILAGSSTNAESERPPVRIARTVPPLKVGAAMPDYPFTNEMGQATSFSKYAGDAYAFTLIYTHCPFPTFCPQMSKNFAAASRMMTGLTNAPSNWHLFTITFDPHRDTPEVLRNYGRTYEYDPERWTFLTAGMIDIDDITDRLDLTVEIDGDQNWTHKLRTVVVDATGHVQKILVGNLWTPPELVQELIKAAQVPPSSAPPAPEPIAH